MIARLAVVFLALAALLAASLPCARAADEAVAEVAKGSNAFAFDLYGRLRAQGGNLFFSPYSITAALGMTAAGAKGDTEAEMIGVLRLPAEHSRLHGAMGALMKDLNGRTIEGRWADDPDDGKPAFVLVTANALWGQKGYPFRKDYLDLVRASYDGGLSEVDFSADTEGARKTINAWVEKKTQDKIQNLLGPGDVTTLTRLVLANAIYFKAAWMESFEEHATRPLPFHLGAGETADVPVMHQQESFPYAETDAARVVALPYKGGDLQMIVAAPKEVDGLAALEEGLTSETLASWIEALVPRQLLLGLPKFKFSSRFRLGDTLAAMGMRRPFGGDADFGRMADTKELFIGQVIHQAFVDVNEAGTEAAAATAVVMEGRGMPPKPLAFIVDRPFLFLIRDAKTGLVLFFGRVANPAGE